MTSYTPIPGLIHGAIMLVVSDLDHSAHYYCDLLGFALREKSPHLALLECGSLLLYLVTHSDPTPDKPTVTLALTNTHQKTSVNLVLRVRDCQQAYTELTRRGVAFLTPPQSPPWGGWRCFTRDPDGYLIEIEQPSAGD